MRSAKRNKSNYKISVFTFKVLIFLFNKICLMKRVLLILGFISFMFCVNSQNINDNINIIQDSRIDTLINTHIIINENKLSNPENDGISGYRINIFFDSGNNSKSMAEKTKENFIEKYPGTGVYISFRSPFYYVRIGDYRTKIEAEAFFRKINKYYPNAWIIKDEINFPLLDKNINLQTPKL